MTAPLFLLETLSEALGGDGSAPERVVLDGAEGHHAADVRRVRVGEAVDVADGRGLLVHGVVDSTGRGRVAVAVQSVVELPPAQPRLVVVQALTKGGRDTDAVEAMTEVGVDELVPWAAARSVAKWSDGAARRWTATAREAAKQSRRAWLPDVAEVASTATVCERLRAAELALVLHESAERSLATDVAAVPAREGTFAIGGVPHQGEIVIVVGPEGGITEDECVKFADAGALVCRLGDTVLRTSTAGTAALAVLLAASRWR